MTIPAFELLLAGLSSLVACVLIIATRSVHGHLSFDSTMGIQKVHEGPTPRVGGVAIAVSLVLAVLVAPSRFGLLQPLLLAAIPAFLAGLVEDTTKRVSVRARLFATVISGVLAWYLTGISLARVNVVGLDYLLAYLPVSVFFTAFAVAGASNAINIIDGFNGLAAGAVLIALAGLGAIAYSVADFELLSVILLVACVTLGFMTLNFPFGKIFLGDGGAYLLGFLLAWVAVLLPMRNPSVSVWASLLACGYPIMETVFSISRRSFREGHAPGQADHLHLHTLVYRRVMRKLFPLASRRSQNARTSPAMWLFAVAPAAWGIVFYESTGWLVVGALFTAFVYRALYLRLTQFRWCFSPALRNLRAASQRDEAVA